jgi:hypothetical protein
VWEDRGASDLDRYVDALHGERRSGLPPTPPGLEDLASLARWLRYLLVPVEPAPLFRQALHARLLTAAKVEFATPAPSWQDMHKRELLIGAAVGSALSLAGIAAVIARLRWTTRNAA